MSKRLCCGSFFAVLVVLSATALSLQGQGSAAVQPKKQESMGLFMSAGHHNGQYRGKPALIRVFHSVANRNEKFEMVIPNGETEEDLAAFKAIGHFFDQQHRSDEETPHIGDVLRVRFYSLPPVSTMVMSSIEHYNKRPPESDKPDVFVFWSKTTQRVNGQDRPAVLVEKALKTYTLLVPLKKGPDNKMAPDAEMLSLIDRLEDGDCVKLQSDGKSINSIISNGASDAWRKVEVVKGVQERIEGKTIVGIAIKDAGGNSTFMVNPKDPDAVDLANRLAALKAGEAVQIQTRNEGGKTWLADVQAAPKGETKLSTASLDLGNDSKGNNIKLQLVLIPAGKFLMGTNFGYGHEGLTGKTEVPQHEVTITKPFYMGIYVVTEEQYVQVIGIKKYSKLKGWSDAVGIEVANRPKYPFGLSWDDAVEFCKKLSQKTGNKVRLPTEAEWEYACRAGTTTKYFFGDDPKLLGDYAWYMENSGSVPHPVGLKKPNPWGLYDMLGNGFQWCSDWYARYEKEPQIDPTGPQTDPGYGRVKRGSGGSEDQCRCGYRMEANSGGAVIRVVVEAPLSAPPTGVFKFLSLEQGKTFTVLVGPPEGGETVKLAIPAMVNSETDPDPKIVGAFKKAKHGDLLKVTYIPAPDSQGLPTISSLENYEPNPGEVGRGMHLFGGQATQIVNGQERPAVVLHKYLQETTLLIPMKEGPGGKLAPDPKIMSVIDGLKQGDSVQVQVEGKTFSSIRKYVPK